MSDNIEAIYLNIKNFILVTFPKARHEQITPSTKLFDDNIIDSLGFLGILNFIEHAYEIKIHDEEIAENNFSSIERMAALIEKKLKNGESGRLG
mgnify:CR=1 FL=1